MERRLALAAVVLIAAAGCRTSAIYVPAVRTQLAAQPAEVRAGDTVRLAVTITNPRPDTVLLEFGEECRVSFNVLDDADRPIGHEDTDARCIVPGAGRLVLAPGETWRGEAAWQASRGGDPLPAGAYTIAAVLGDHHSTVRGKRDYKMGSGAGRASIRVLPPSQ
ncbi:MAG TPA: BsuPI-related putative proteinase inhibitor [Armatimonadota bacterium]|nr:BsuPI-related putative proteinase inhibitor [Armatimonadota bacterium]